MTNRAPESDAPGERAIVVASIPPGTDPERHVIEIQELLNTAGVATVSVITQVQVQPHPRTYVGSGKLDEVHNLCMHFDPDVVVIDDEISPTQQRNIEDKLKVRVLDRTAVILDIFALHANTAQGKLQVELAQLEYYLTRARGMWQHLTRLGGGVVGTRGPGESQLETDRRLARRKISVLRRRLDQHKRQRRTMRSARDKTSIPKVALAGYTNAGKSTLLNRLTGSDVSVKDALFETLDPTTRAYESEGRRYLVTDTVGFIERLPHQLVDAFASTLEETILADMVVVVADASLPEREMNAQIEAVREVLHDIGAGDMPQLLALNKIDKLAPDERSSLARRFADSVEISAVTGEGIDELMSAVAESFAARFTRVELLVPYAQAGLLNELYLAGAPIERSDEEDGIHAIAHVPESLLGRVAGYVVDGDVLR